MRQAKCRWNCGQVTKNISRICNDCWQAAEALRSNADAGYRAPGLSTSERRQARPEVKPATLTYKGEGLKEAQNSL